MMGIDGDQEHLDPNVKYRVNSSVVQEREDALLNITILGRDSLGGLGPQTELERGVRKVQIFEYGRKEMWKLGETRLKWRMMVLFESRFVDTPALFQ